MGIWDLIIAPVAKIIDKVVPDTAARDAAKAALEQMTASGALQEELIQLQAMTTAQTEINKVEAASSSMFVAGWRPYIGWVCGTGLAMDCIIRPLVNWASALHGHPVDFPNAGPLLQTVMAGMLGLGHISRTYEKVQGVVGQH